MSSMDYKEGRGDYYLAEANREERKRKLRRGMWLHYTTHQVACPVGAWNTKDKEAICTCGYTLLVDAAIECGAE